MTLQPGTTLGPYEIVSLIGAGGMGEVYRARDTKLKREVALKVLPAGLANDAERLARFQREAEVLASLNHPHIAHIYGLEQAGDTSALAMELVDGEDLSVRITRGPMSLDEALPIARQIVDGLEAAHERGIIHRDLKPANIKVRADGTVKVLDFGLAKLSATGALGDSGAASETGETCTSPAMTGHGVILGTAAYMAPEQAKGKPVDKRADIWAFGCVLYEMLTGHMLFAGDSVAEMIGLVVTRVPDWSALPPETPARVRRVLQRCLQKDPRQRLRDIGDVRIELDASAESIETPVTVQNLSPTRGRLRERVAWALAGTLAIALIVLSTSGRSPWPPEPSSGDVIRFSLPAPEGRRFLSRPDSLAISADGRIVAFVANDGSNLSSLWIRPLSALPATQARLPPSVVNAALAAPSWSPDGQYLVTTAGTPIGGPVRKIDPAGGPAVDLAEWGTNAIAGNGVVVYTGRDGRLYRVADTGGVSTPASNLDPALGETRHLATTFLPDGRRFLLVASGQDLSKLGLYIASIDSPTTRTRIGAFTSGPVKYAAGFLWFVRDGTLMAQRFHPDAGQTTGEPVPVVEDVEVFAVSESGALVYLPRDRSGVTMTWLDVAGKPAGTVGPAGLFDSGRPDLSSDGRRLVFSTSNASGGSDLWMLDLERNIPTRLTSADTRIAEPRFTPAGSHVVFLAGRNTGLYRRASDGSGTDELLYDPRAVIVGPDTALPSGFSADGKLLVFMTRTPETGADVWILPLEGNRKPFAFAATKSLEGYAAFSPDGRWIAYCSAEPGQGDHIYVEPYPRTGARTRLSSTPGSSPQWSANSREVLYNTPGGLDHGRRADVRGGCDPTGLPRVWQRAGLVWSQQLRARSIQDAHAGSLGSARGHCIDDGAQLAGADRLASLRLTPRVSPRGSRA